MSRPTRIGAGLVATLLFIWMLVLLLGHASFRAEPAGKHNYTASCVSIWDVGFEDGDSVQLLDDHVYADGVDLPDNVTTSDFDDVTLDQACNARRDSRLGLMAVLAVPAVLFAAIGLFGLRLPGREGTSYGSGARR